MKVSVMMLMISTVCIAENFTVAKKKVSSCKVAKEECGHLSHDTIKQSFSVSKKLAVAQEQLTNNVEDILDGNKNSFWAQASKEQLADYQEALERFNEVCKQFERELDRFSNIDMRAKKSVK